MLHISCEMLINCHSALGEGPVWDERESALYWIDGLGRRWFRMKDGAVREWKTASPLGSLVLREGGGLIAGLRGGLYDLDLRSGAQTLFVNPEAGIQGNRFNDGKADPAGRYVIGTMSEANNDGSSGGAPAGSLYSVEPDGSWRRLRGGVSISNGLAWNRAKDTLYYIDSPTRQVVAYGYDVKTGNISGGRVCAEIPEGEGIPDGMTIDEEDKLWVAQWEGWCVSRFDPETGERLAKIDVPVERVTCCAFGGPDMDELFITTAAGGVEGIEWLKQPMAGAVFVAKPGVRGLPAYRFGKGAGA